MLQFISHKRHSFISPFEKFIDIEYNTDLDQVRASSKVYIGWNWFTNINTFSYRRSLNLPYLCVERGALPGSIFFDKNGFNFNSSSYRESNWDQSLQSTQLKLINKYITDYREENDPKLNLEFQETNNISKSSITEQINCYKFKKIIFIPFQLSHDTVIRHFAGKIESLEKFITTINSISKKNKDILFIFKNHPLQQNKVLKETDNLICVDNFHFKACLDVCDIVMCINSGVGLQAMLYEKPCLLFGQAFYRYEGLNYQVEDITQAIDYIRSDLSFDTDKSKRFLFWLNYEFYSSVDWVSIKDKNTSFLKNINRFNIWTEGKTYRYK